MAITPRPTIPYLRLHLIGIEKHAPSVQEFANFFYDFNLLYEILRLALDPRYSDYRFTHITNYRRGRNALDSEDRLYLDSVALGSPLDVVAVVTIGALASGAIWALIQSAEKLYNIPLNRRKLRAEVEKLERENTEARRNQFEISDKDLLRALASREAGQLYDNAVKRLQESPILLSSVEPKVIVPRRRDEENR